MGQVYFNLTDTTITANQMSINKDGDFFYIDVLVEAGVPGEPERPDGSAHNSTARR